MLILTRHVGEKITISPSIDIPPDMTVSELFADGPIEIMLVKMKGNQAGLGLAAPKNLTILRNELAPK